MIKDYFQLPVNSTWVSTKYSSRHTALDLGWIEWADRSQPIYPIAEGVVVDVGWYDDGGWYVWTKHEDDNNTWYAGYMHMREKSSLKVGTKVKRTTQLGRMGETGKSVGPHVHLVLVKAPKGTKWSNSGTRKYRVDPAKHIYRFPHQKVNGGEAKIKDKPKTPYIQEETDTVTVKKSAKKYATGEKIDDWVKGTTFDVHERAKGKTLIKRDGSLIGWVKNSDLEGSKEEAKPKPKPKPSKPKYKKVTAKVVNDVINGKYGNGAERKKKLEKAGYNYKEVQDVVNRSYGAKPKTPTIKRGDKIKIKSSGKDLNKNIKFASWVYNTTMYVTEVQKRGYVFSDKKHGGVIGVVGRNHVVKV